MRVSSRPARWGVHGRYVLLGWERANTRISTKITARRQEKILMHTCAEFGPLGSIVHRNGVFCTRSLLYLSEGHLVHLVRYLQPSLATTSSCLVEH